MGMRILKTMRKQDAVYWGSPSPDGLGGSTTDKPIALKVRWEDREEEFTTTLGTEISKSIVYVPNIAGGVKEEGAELEIQGYLKLGTLADLKDSDLPKDNGALKIRGYAKLPTLKGDEFLRTCWL